MKRVVIPVAICGAAAIVAALTLAIYAATHQWRVSVDGQVPFESVLKQLAATWAPPLLTVGLAASVALLFLLAVRRQDH